MSDGLHRTDSIQNRRTPRAVFDALDAEFRFELDAAADADNALCHAFMDEEINAFNQEWNTARSVFLNPPFSGSRYKHEKGMGAWLLKVREQVAAHGITVVVIAPGDWSPKWFWDHVWGIADEVRLVHPRVHFARPDGRRESGASRAPFVFVYRAGVSPARLRLAVTDIPDELPVETRVVPWTWR